MNDRYTKTAVFLHWLIALGIFFMLALGWFMTDLPKEAPKQMNYDLFNLGVVTWDLVKAESPRAFYYNFHKSIGVTLLVLIAIRVLWRVTHKPPTPLASYKAWERKLSTGAHHFLYTLMVVIPVSGLIMSIGSKYGVKWFGIKIFSGLDSKPLREIFIQVHETAVIILFFILVLHIIGALKHKFIDKDDTMKRMLP